MIWLLAGCAQQTAERWLSAVARGDDEAAYAGLEVAYPPPGGWTEERFVKRVARLPALRAGDDVRWTSQVRHTVRADLDGVLPYDGRDVKLSLGVIAGKVRDVKVGEVDLVPRDDYHVIPDARPIRDWAVEGLAASVDPRGLAVIGQAAEPGTLTIRARCRPGPDDWVAGALQARADGPFRLVVDVPPAPPCQLALALDTSERRAATACWTGAEVTPGPCAEYPTPDPAAGVRVRRVAVRFGGGVSVDYELRADAPQPAPYADESAVVTTVVTCPGGTRPVRHTRPVDAEWLEPGVWRRLGSPMKLHAEGRPCDVSLDYARDDHYDRVEVPLYRGCADADGALTDGPCVR